jgi:hypothetical protein
MRTVNSAAVAIFRNISCQSTTYQQWLLDPDRRRDQQAENVCNSVVPFHPAADGVMLLLEMLEMLEMDRPEFFLPMQSSSNGTER